MEESKIDNLLKGLKEPKPEQGDEPKVIAVKANSRLGQVIKHAMENAGLDVNDLEKMNAMGDEEEEKVILRTEKVRPEWTEIIAKMKKEQDETAYHLSMMKAARTEFWAIVNRDLGVDNNMMYDEEKNEIIIYKD